jgi:hypothetical protein
MSKIQKVLFSVEKHFILYIQKIKILINKYFPMLSRTPQKFLPKSLNMSQWAKAFGVGNLTNQRFYHSGVDNFSITSECKSAIEKFLIPNGK